ncbi:MAG: tetratricopeptide repeat protein [Prevotellaceae bacterium]|jgi:tetratricopeptide (TPR) repeat protein|nr:tetratricopeptide repeat protein [Prevotellaceae bacterium]
MKRLYILLIGLFAVSNIAAQSIDTLWNKANELYAVGSFKEASDIYRNIVNDGNESADLYYNLANSYYKQNMLGKAILYYERAYRLNSSNEDIIYNLEFAKTQVLDKVDPLPTFFVAKTLQSIKDMFIADGWATVAIALFAIGLFLILSAYFFVRRLSLRRISFWVGVLAIILCLLSNMAARSIVNVDEAIIMSPVSTIKSSPDASGKELFILHEGTKVHILDELSGWKKIKISNGNQGWIEAKDIEQI